VSTQNSCNYPRYASIMHGANSAVLTMLHILLVHLPCWFGLRSQPRLRRNFFHAA